MKRWLLALCLMVLPVQAEEIVSGVSQSGVSITTNFDGASILVYGAALRDTPAPTWPLMEVIITVEGPSTPLVIRKKDHVAGIWLNRGAVKITAAPSFYAVASTKPVADILLPAEDAKYHITIPQTIDPAAAPSAEQAPYIEALQRIRQASGSFVLAPDSVLLLRQSLFRTDISLPANLVEGPYMVRIFLTRGGTWWICKKARSTCKKQGSSEHFTASRWSSL